MMGGVRVPSAGEAVLALRAFVTGVADSLSVHSSAIFFLTSRKVRMRSLSCLALNGLIFVGSLQVHDLVVAPLLAALLRAEEGDEAAALLGGWLAEALAVLQLVLWTLPIYVISFGFNMVWYQDIADNAFLIRGGRPDRPPVTWQRLLSSFAQVLYRLLLSAAFLVQAYLCYLVPVVGRYVAALHFSWVYALQAFDYKWALEGWPVEKALTYFERRWAYMAGFGFPCALITVAFPPFVSYGVYAFVFPVFIILAIIARPVAHIRGDDAYEEGEMRPHTPVPPHNPGRLPIFRFAKIFNAHLLRCLHRRASAAATTKSG